MPDDRIRDEHERDLRAIAHLVARIRPEWHQPGVMAVLRDCPDDKLADTAIAALVCARDRTDQATPAVIALDGAHWRTGTRAGDEPEAKPALTPSTRCGTCYRSRDGHDHAEALVDPEHRHPWITEADMRAAKQRAERPDQTRNLDRTPLPDRSTRRNK